MPVNSMNELLYMDIVKAALHEDVRSGDATTSALIPDNVTARAEMRFREPGVVCGLDVACSVFEHVNPYLEVSPIEAGGVLAIDGDEVSAGHTVLVVEGSANAILTAERVALNFVQRMSGIATLTRYFVDSIAGTEAKIADTRKTTPGLRLLEKYAVRCGGGTNHRFALDDLILIKDNHIAVCGGIAEAVRRARNYAGHAMKVEVECDTLEQVREAVAAQADIILLDNMSPDVLRQAVGIVGGAAITEASGGINLDTARAVAESGVDVISVGQLTHGARSLDIGLDIELG